MCYTRYQRWPSLWSCCPKFPWDQRAQNRCFRERKAWETLLDTLQVGGRGRALSCPGCSVDWGRGQRGLRRDRFQQFPPCEPRQACGLAGSCDIGSLTQPWPEKLHQSCSQLRAASWHPSSKGGKETHEKSQLLEQFIMRLYHLGFECHITKWSAALVFYQSVVLSSTLVR